MWGPLLTVAVAGLAIAVTLAFWAEIQSWLSGVLERSRAQLGEITHPLQSALVTLDRVMVNGQRLVAVTARAVFTEQATHKIIVVEEKRHMEAAALPADIIAKLDKGETLSYDLTGN